MTTEVDDVALKLLHTADWHLGKRFPSFDNNDELTLTRARLEVLGNIFRAADQYDVDAILCAGDLFDEPNPSPEWWGALAKKLKASSGRRPIFLLPGNHDPLQPGSVYEKSHPFRAELPRWVHVVDEDDYTYALNENATLYARPCRSRAGQDDPAMALPARAPGDERIRIGMVHGSTFDYANCQTNFPIAKTAAAVRGFDYLAIGDTHSFRNVPENAVPPVVYPGAPEPTAFDEHGAGNVVRVFVNRSRKVLFSAERVAAWTWHERTARTLAELKDIHADSAMSSCVVRLHVDMRLTAAEFAEAEEVLRELKGGSSQRGRIGVLQLHREGLHLDTRDIEKDLKDLPAVLLATVNRLKALENGEQADAARAALYQLYRLVREARA